MKLEEVLEELKNLKLFNKETSITTISSHYRDYNGNMQKDSIDLQNEYERYDLTIYYKEGENKLVVEVECYDD